MGWQIIQQPNDLYCIWCNTMDEFVRKDLSEQEVIDVFNRRELERIQEKTEEIKGIIKQLNEGGKPYHQFTKTYQEKLDFLKEKEAAANAD